MQVLSPETTFSLSLQGTGRAASRTPSAPEEEVIRLFDQLRNPLLRYVLSFGLTVSDGEEIVQEVFLALFQHLRREAPRRNLRGWIFRVGHNLALKQRVAISRIPRQAAVSRCGLVEEQPDTAPGPEEQAAASQRQRRLHAVIRALPEQDQYCLYLRAEGLRYREIAEVLRISLGGVAASLARSLTRLGRAAEF